MHVVPLWSALHTPTSLRNGLCCVYGATSFLSLLNHGGIKGLMTIDDDSKIDLISLGTPAEPSLLRNRRLVHRRFVSSSTSIPSRSRGWIKVERWPKFDGDWIKYRKRVWRRAKEFAMPLVSILRITQTRAWHFIVRGFNSRKAFYIAKSITADKQLGQPIFCSASRKPFRFTYSRRAQWPLWPSCEESILFGNFLFRSHRTVLIFDSCRMKYYVHDGM